MTTSVRPTAIREKANVVNIVATPPSLVPWFALLLARLSFATPQTRGAILS
jgi:hypothetical protein